MTMSLGAGKNVVLAVGEEYHLRAGKDRIIVPFAAVNTSGRVARHQRRFIMVAAPQEPGPLHRFVVDRPASPLTWAERSRSRSN
jgi:hypothetical protein